MESGFQVFKAGTLGNFFIEAVFRAIEEKQPTLLIDEADTFLQGNDELRGILNSGYTRKTAFVVRVGPEGKSTSPRPSDSVVPTPSALGGPSTAANSFRRFPTDGSPPAERGRSREGEVTSISESRLVRFSCWCPKVMAAIGHLPETLADRCIVIRMQRKTSSEECEKLRNLDGSILRRKCARFVKDRGMEIASARPALPLELNDRAGDVWEPLLPLFCTPFCPRIAFFPPIGRIYTACASLTASSIYENTMPRPLAQLDEEYRRLSSRLADIGYITQGSVFERKQGSGSRYQWTWKNKDQKTESLTLTREQYDWLRRAVANQRKLKRTLQKMRQISEQVFARSTKRNKKT